MALRRPGTGSTLTSRSNPEGDEDGRQQEHKPLQEWLESISQRMMNRIDALGGEVQKLVDECGAVELDLKNTFNSFRCLSSTQFVENRVYEEDETESVRAETPAQESQHPFAPTESYEDEIMPRYKDAVSTAWATFQEISYQHDQASRRLRARNKVLRNLDYDGRLHLVPHVIGTDEFARDIHCGLAELRHKRSVVDGFEVDSDTEREGADLAAELVGAGSVSEGEWSEAESDTGDQGGGFEPAVSAAMDFKAMLEAALRNPSLPYDGKSSTHYGEEVNNDYFLSDVAIDNYYGSARTIPRRVESGDHRAGDTSANTGTSDSGGGWQLTGSHIPGEVTVQSTGDSAGVSSSPPSQPGRDEQPLRATMEELLKKPFILKTENSTKEDAQNSSGSNIQLEYSGIANIPFIPGGLFDDDEDDTVSVSSGLANVRDSNTEPTVPDGLFQRKPSPGAAEHTNVESRSSSSVDLDQSKSPARMPSYTTGRQYPKLDAGTLFKSSESKGSMKLEISDPSSSLENVENISTRPETSNGFKEQVTSTLPTQIRGGLFDDSDEDEDAGDLFGKSLSIKVTDAGITSQPVLRTWTSVSSKGLFDDLEYEADTQETLVPQPSGSSSERRKSDELPSLLRQVSSSGRGYGHLPPGQSSWTSTSGSTSESFQKQTSSSSLSGNTFDRNQKQIPTSSPSGSTPTTTGILTSSSSLSESYTDPLQKQSPSYSLSRSTQNRTHQQFSDSFLSGSGSDGTKRQLFGSIVDSTQKQSSSSSLVGSVPDRANIDHSAVNIDSEEDRAKEKTSEPHANLASLLTAGIRATARTVVYSSDDSDSWSSSGSDADGDMSSSRGKRDSLKSLKGLETPTEGLESSYKEDTVREIDWNRPAAHALIEHKRSSSGESPKVLVPEDMRKSPSSSLGSEDVSSSSSPTRPGRSLSHIQVMEMREEQNPVTSLSSDLEPMRRTLPLVDQTAKSGVETSSNTAGAEKLVHITVSRSLGPSKRRTSTSLFDEDDGEDELFGTNFPQKQCDSQFGSEPQGTKSPLDLPTDLQKRKRDEAKGLPSPAKSSSSPNLFQTRERGEAEERGFPLKSKFPLDLFTTIGQDVAKDVASPARSKSPVDISLDVASRGRDEAKEAPVPAQTLSPVPSRAFTTSPAKMPDIKVDDGELSSRRSASRLSSLLFGDDEDSEDALFGPLREKSSRGSSDWLVSTSSFAPAKTTATRRNSGSSLFDD